MLKNINYWELREMIIKIVPRMTQLIPSKRRAERVREKGRKKNYSQFNLKLGEWRKQERLLNTEEINSFLEVSVRSAACPMPFNMDVWDGLTCPFNCIYCFANSFRASLYTAFFDNSKTMGLRHCNPTFYKKELDKMEKLRVLSPEEIQKTQGINKAYALGIPLRMGIRFEDFLKNEKKGGVALEMLEHLKAIKYPVMINTKSALVGEDKYVKALSENEAKSAVHVTVISADNQVLKDLEPGAPDYKDRMKGIKAMTSAGIRVVARIEPYLFLLTDSPDYVKKYQEDMIEAGVRHITFDTYSYTANNSGIRQIFINQGYDYDRMFLAGSDSQPLGSLLLGKFMDLFREAGFSCSTFDMGNSSTNNDKICCEVGDWFEDSGWNYGCTMMAARFIQGKKGKPVTWKMFVKYVDKNGGFLTPSLKVEVKELWNLSGNMAYSHSWAAGLKATGQNEDGNIWRHDPDDDHRLELLESIL